MGKIIISGTGRTGTTFLMQMFIRLGMDTGFTEEDITDEPGLEWNLLNWEPRILKSPLFCADARKLVDTVDIDYLIIPVRDIVEVAHSRRKRGDKDGGLWGTKCPSEQEDVLLKYFHNLCLEASKKDIPVIFINYPKSIRDSQYLYGKLKPILGTGYKEFEKIFNQTVKK